jgi:hypothetical protein
MSADNENANKMKIRSLSFLKLALFLLILITIIGVALFAFMDITPADALTQGLSGLYDRIFAAGKTELSEKTKTIIDYNYGSQLACAAVTGNLAVADISSVRIYDPDGREKTYVPVNLKKPFIQSWNKDIIIADLKGRYLALMSSDGRILWEKTIDEDIINASISDNWILLITKSQQSGYKRTIRALSKDGQTVALRNISNYFPFSADHYPEFSMSSFVVSGIDISGLETVGVLDFLDPTMNQKGSIRGEKEILAGGVPIEQGKILLYGEKTILMLDDEYRTIWEKKFTESILTAAGVLDKKYPVIAEYNTEVFSRENRNETKVTILNTDSTEKADIEVNGKVTRIVSFGKTAAVQVGAEAFFINSNGEIMDSFAAKTDIISIHMAKENLAYVVIPGNIVRVNIDTNHKFLGIF